MIPSNNCIKLIKQFEGCKLEPYLDSKGIPTIGFGSIYHLDNKTSVSMDDSPISQEEADKLLYNHIEEMSKTVLCMIEVDIGQNQCDAVFSLVYNIGIGNFRKSTLLKLLNNDEIEKAADQFLVWDTAAGKTIEGLSRRRRAERELFLS